MSKKRDFVRSNRSTNLTKDVLCQNCRYYRRTIGSGYGFCTRFPPVLVIERWFPHIVYDAQHPHIAWCELACGEFQRREAVIEDAKDTGVSITTWQDIYGHWHARDFRWLCSGRGATEEEAREDVRQEIAEIERQGFIRLHPKYS